MVVAVVLVVTVVVTGPCVPAFCLFGLDFLHVWNISCGEEHVDSDLAAGVTNIVVIANVDDGSVGMTTRTLIASQLLARQRSLS